MSARDIDHAEQLFGRIRGVLDRAEWGTKAERTNAAWAILDELLRTPTQPPRLALARALVPECAVVPREDAADHIEAIDMWLGDNADETPASVWGSINILRAMLAAGEATDDGR